MRSYSTQQALAKEAAVISKDIFARLEGETIVVALEVNAGEVPLPEEGVTAPSVGGTSGTVHVPTATHPEFTVVSEV